MSIVILFVVTCLGLCMYANYYNCDPLSTMKVGQIDEVGSFVSVKYQQEGSRILGLPTEFPVPNLGHKYISISGVRISLRGRQSLKEYD